jgi:hypothetical protein
MPDKSWELHGSNFMSSPQYAWRAGRIANQSISMSGEDSEETQIYLEITKVHFMCNNDI